MPELYYKEALKQGKKEYRACISKGEYPYLPVLDEILADRLPGGERDLGITQIPTEFIAGTKTSGRASVFARNFMPLAKENSEFADKWQRLCSSHLEEGIREPIKAYEYLNRYYVEEGNKRVSVLKFFDSVSISAHVIRIPPSQNDSAELAMYQELTDFYRLSGVNFIEFSKPGSCQRLQKLLGRSAGIDWTPEETSAFTAAYYAFKAAYESMGGSLLRITVGDAMLAYLEIYGVASLRQTSGAEIQKNISRVWEEISLRQQDDPIHVKLNPDEKKQSLISKVLSSGEAKTIRAAFIHDGSPAASGWTRGHEQGREYVQRTMGDIVSTKAYLYAMDHDPRAVMEQAISDGYTVLFATSPRLLPEALKIAVAHPEVTVFNCSLNTSHRYIRTYYARMYEAKFVIGAIAGAMAGNDPIGYLCDYPIYGQIAGINAFALGAQMVNPKARVLLEWSSVGGSDAALSRLTNQGVRLISSQDLVRMGDEWRSMGLSLFSAGKPVNLATPLWQWGTYYEKLLNLIRSHSEESTYRQSEKALNYYWGMSAGVIDLVCSEKLPPSTRKMADLLKESIREGLCNPFKGPLYTQTGKVLDSDWSLSPEQIIAMDFLADNVVGEIPNYDAISSIAKETVAQMGVDAVKKDIRG